MPAGLKQTSSVVSIGFNAVETVANTFAQSVTDLNLSPLDQEVFVVLAIDMHPVTPDAIAATDTRVLGGVTSTSQTAMVGLDNANCIAIGQNHIKAAGFLDGGCAFQSAGIETPPANLEYIGIIATNDFFVQVEGRGNLGTKSVSGKMYGYRARADAAIYAALVQSEALSA